ncbi:MAG TPA: PilZ domain-containing protein, partial [Candidatus Acidoferrum sp.]|nr:PilZ domain-containing protein [Candidatus Acidoferrum sp.]
MSEWAAQRRHPRHPIRLPALYKVMEPPPATAGVGWTRDLSEGGACLEVADYLEPMSQLTLLLRTEEGGLELRGEVVWAARSEPAGQPVLHGVSFVQLSEDQRKALVKLFTKKEHMRLEGLRLPLELPISCRPTGMTGPVMQGHTGDVSRGGLLLLLPEVIPPDFPLEVTIQTSRGNVEAKGVIVWVGLKEKQAAGEMVR